MATAIYRSDLANADLIKTIKRIYPVGRRVSWLHGKHRQYGHVEGHECLWGTNFDIWVENERTDKRVRVNAGHKYSTLELA